MKGKKMISQKTEEEKRKQKEEELKREVRMIELLCRSALRDSAGQMTDAALFD